MNRAILKKLLFIGVLIIICFGFFKLFHKHSAFISDANAPIDGNSNIHRSDSVVETLETINFDNYISITSNDTAVSEADCSATNLKKNRSFFERPEDEGEDYSSSSTGILLTKLKNGDKIEQRKAANALWTRFGATPLELSDSEKKEIAEAAKGYLQRINEDFEENFMQLQRLWHLAAPSLLVEITAQDVSISENAARLLSVMKTPQIIDELIAQSEKAESKTELDKYIFALEYMKINNRYFVENRNRMSDDDCKEFFMSRVLPHINKLKQRLDNEEYNP